MSMLQTRLSEIRNGLKLARRSVSRNLTQSLLIVLIMAIPVAGVSFTQIYQQSRVATSDEAINALLGQTEALFLSQNNPSDCLMQDPKAQLNADGPWLMMVVFDEAKYQACIEEQGSVGFTDPTNLLPAADWLVEQRSSSYAKVGKRLVPVELVIGEAWNPALEGRYRDLTGEVPSQANEVLISSDAMKRLELAIGDSLEIETGSRPLKIVGTLDSNNDPSDAVLVFGLESVYTLFPDYQRDNPFFTNYFLINQQVEWLDVVEYNRLGVAVVSRLVVTSPPSDEDVPLYQEDPWYVSDPNMNGLFGTLGLFIALLFPVGTLSASAFAFGVRRQARNLAVIASLGASSRMLKLVNVLSGLWLGLLGATLGVLLATGFAWWRLESDFDGSVWSFPGFHMPWLEIGLSAALGISFGVIFSLWPAIRASRVDIQSQLRGTRTEGNPRARGGFASLLLIALGLLLMAIGIAWSAALDQAGARYDERFSVPYFALAGGMLAALGLMTGSIWVVKLLQVTVGKLRGPISYSLRDTVFNHKRYVPVISSILAVVFVGTFLSVSTYSSAKSAQTYQTRTMPSNQAMLDIEFIVPGLASSSFTLTEQQISDRVAAAEPLLDGKLAELLEIGALDAATLSGQPRPAMNPMDGSYKEGSEPFARIAVDPKYICPWDERHPEYEAYMKAEEAQDLEMIEKLGSTASACGTVDPIWSLILVGNENDLEVATAGKASVEAKAALAAGEVISLAPDWIQDKQVVFEFIDPSLPTNQTPIKTISSSAFFEPVEGNRFSVFMSPATAAEIGLTVRPVVLSGYFPDAINEFDLEELRYVWTESVDFDYSSTIWTPDNIVWGFTAAIALFALMIALISIGLAQIESRADRSALWAVGASRGYRSRVVGLQGFLLTLIGTSLGTAIGVITAIDFVQIIGSQDDSYVPQLPIIQLLTLALLVPVLVGVISAFFGSGKLTRKRSALD